MIQTRHLLFVLVAMTASFACAGGADEEAANPAYAWHDSVMTAMGGEDAWERTRYLTFRWNVYRGGELVSDRKHHWDRYRGDYRLETTMRGSPEEPERSLTVLFNVNTREGQAFVGGQPADEALNDSLVERAYGMFINDSYWLLMPYKWSDPGVNLEHVGAESDEDGGWQVFHLSFEEVGLTPGDQYWVYVSADPPHLVGKWRYHLQSMEERGPFIYWRNWQRFGGIMLATLREGEGDDFRIEFTDIEASRRTPDGVFEPPASVTSD